MTVNEGRVLHTFDRLQLAVQEVAMHEETLRELGVIKTIKLEGTRKPYVEFRLNHERDGVCVVVACDGAMDETGRCPPTLTTLAAIKAVAEAALVHVDVLGKIGVKITEY